MDLTKAEARILAQAQAEVKMDKATRRKYFAIGIVIGIFLVVTILIFSMRGGDINNYVSQSFLKNFFPFLLSFWQSV